MLDGLYSFPGAAMLVCLSASHCFSVVFRWLKREAQKPDTLFRVADTVSDRLRVPWITGAKRVDLSLVPPLVLLPILLRIAALHVFLGVVVLTALPGLVLWYYYFTHRKKGRTLFFLSLALFSLAYMYYLFVTEIVPVGDVTSTQLATVTLGVILTIVSLIHTKRGPGYVKPRLADTHSTVTYHSPLPAKDSAHLNGVRHQVVIANRGVGAAAATLEHQANDGAVEAVPPGQTDTKKKNWCPWCRTVRPPRAGHCRICSACIQRLDHHCVWWVSPIKTLLCLQQGLCLSSHLTRHAVATTSCRRLWDVRQTNPQTSSPFLPHI